MLINVDLVASVVFYYYSRVKFSKFSQILFGTGISARIGLFSFAGSAVAIVKPTVLNF